MKYCPHSIWSVLTNELAKQSSLSAQRDIAYALSRYKHEGDSFFGITLPNFSASILRCVEEGYASRSFFEGFSFKKGECLPKFLSGFTKQMFVSSGELKVSFDPDILYSIRQICDLWKKANAVCSKERTEKALETYFNTDKELTYVEKNQKRNFRTSNLFTCISDILNGDLSARFRSFDLLPKHGPGATAERLTANQRLRFTEWPIRCEPYFPSSRHAIPNIGWLAETRGSKFSFLSDEQVQPSRVVLVPKTLKTPRVIAIEPSYLQYMQQATLSYLTRQIESSPLTRNSIRFTDQSHNRVCAHKASTMKHLATIDLSEASDRVSNAMVRKWFSDNLLGRTIQSCRSTTSVLPDGKLIKLNKFASMGSANCFPIESLMFYTLIQCAVHRFYRQKPSVSSIKRYSKSISVYGDDIIVPVAWLGFVIRELEDNNLKVNTSKSFSKSKFRESCGGDYYDGYDVKAIYLRANFHFSDNTLSIKDLLSMASTSNQFYLKGLWGFCSYLRSIISSSSIVKNKGITVPHRNYETDGLYFYACNYSTYDRWNVKFNRFNSRTLCGEVTNVVDDITSCNVSLMTLGLRNIGNDNPKSPVKSVRPYTLREKCRWVA